MIGIKPKGLKEVLKEDASLTKKLTLNEFQQAKLYSDNSEYSLADAYRDYRELLLRNL